MWGKIEETLCRAYLTERAVYFEKDSLFKATHKAQTGTSKDKFKLYCRKNALDQYFFYTTTSNINTCDPALTVTVSPADWEEVESPRLKNEDTHINILHFDVLIFSEILGKFIVRRFTRVAALSTVKWEELREKYLNEKERLATLQLDAMNVANFALLGVDSQDELNESLARLGLN